ncbi:MAG: OsmC family protein [Planctomycetota bacterium]
MGEHLCSVGWRRDGAAFVDRRYSRRHEWRFDGGVVVPASASPHAVPAPYSDARCVDPEEAFVAALSSCHMLSFLWLAAQRGVVVDAYDDDAVGTMGKNAAGREGVTRVVLRPRVRCAGPRVPTDDELDALHHEAHEICYIANSVTTQVDVEPVRRA